MIDFPETDKKALFRAVSTFGASAQTDMMIEEMSELTKALLKYRRAGDNESARAVAQTSILEEMADVEIMLAQMHIIYGESYSVLRYKLDRLAARIAKVKEG